MTKLLYCHEFTFEQLFCEIQDSDKSNRDALCCKRVT